VSIKPAIAKQKLAFGALSHEFSILVLRQLLTHQPSQLTQYFYFGRTKDEENIQASFLAFRKKGVRRF
jgi:hypothetical protein